jgi:hypothetical protein
MHILSAVALALSIQPSATCAVTLPNGGVPPRRVLERAGLPANPSPEQWPLFGTSSMWVSLWSEGTVTFRKGGPGFVEPDGALKMKFFWLLATAGPLTVSGKRLDGETSALRSDIPTGFVGRGFQPSYLIFPTPGCWQITARANGSELTFVTRVVKAL